MMSNQKEKKVKAILFDFGNVLGRFCHMQAVKQLLAYSEISDPEILRKKLFFGSTAKMRQTGAMSPEEFHLKLKKDFGLHPSCDFATFEGLWGDIFTPAPKVVLEVLQQLKPGIVTAIASNTEAMHWPYIEKLDTVQFIINRPNGSVYKSYEIGYEKPDERFFTFILDSLGVKPEETLFLDDVDEYVDVFRNMGGGGETFDLRTDNPEVLRSILGNRGALVH
ncbi:MAG: FMN phosphatase YigB (HAD superfamily) [Candidatus Paceibacteria bacterium]|jgi:FMN phosphatase YigB (HAD superfamily)